MAENEAKINTLLSVKKLEEQDDWPQWSKQMKNYLIMNGYNHIMTKQANAPSINEDESPTAFQTRLEAWEDRQARALAAIRDRCGYNAEAIVNGCESIKKTFEELQVAFQPSGSGQYDKLCSQFQDLCLSNCAGVGKFGSELRKVWEQMRTIDASVALPEAFVVQKFLYGLGSGFQDFRTSFNLHYTVVPVTIGSETQPAVTLTRTITCAEEFEARNMKSESKVFLAHGSSERSPRTFGKRKSCVHCGRLHGGECWWLDDSKAPAAWRHQRDLQSRLGSTKRIRSDPEAGVTIMGASERKSSGDVFGGVFLTTNTPESTAHSVLFHSNPKSGEFMTFHRGINLWDAWVLDSGASGHLIGRKDLFVEGTYATLTGVTSNGIGGAKVTPLGSGTIRILCRSNDKPRWLEIPNVQYSPHAGVNLLSLNKLWPFIDTVGKLPDGLSFAQGTEQFSATIRGNLLLLDTWDDPKAGFSGAAYSVEDPKLRLWHERMGHLSEPNLRRLQSMADGMETAQADGRCMCEACVKGRMKERPHSGKIAPGRSALDLIHTDIAGPIRVVGHDQSRFWVTMLDDATQWAEVEPIQRKSQAFECVSKFVKRHETPERRCRRVRLDRGGENVTHEFRAWAYDENIELEYTDTEQHQANGCAESLNRVIEDKLHPTLLASGVEEKYWPAVVQYGIAYLRNRSPSSRMNITPYEAWTGMRPDLSNIRKIGSRAFVLHPQRHRHKVTGSKASEGRLLGFKGRTTYLIRDATGKLDWRTNVLFQEDRPHVGTSTVVPLAADDGDATLLQPWAIPPADAGGQTHVHPLGALPSDGSDSATQSSTGNESDLDPSGDSSAPRSSGSEDGGDQQPTAPEGDNASVWRSPRSNKGESNRYPDREWASLCTFVLLAARATEPYEPRTFEEAQRGAYRTQWKLAMDDEIRSLQNNHTWVLKPRSDPAFAGKHILSGKWVFKIKRNPEGSVQKFKARWVVRGFEQRDGSDYTETFAAVVKPMSYKAIFAIAAALDYEVEQMDVKTAFLYGNVEDTVLVEQPAGYAEQADEVCLLEKALYGLKQSPRIWYDTLTRFLESLGFAALSADLSVFTRAGMIIAIYVDDLLIVGPSGSDIGDVKHALSERFEMTDLGPCHHYLGIELRRDRPNRTIYLNQRSYIEKSLRDLDVWDAKTASTPIDNGKLSASPQGYQAAHELRAKYQRAVGLLMYAMLGTRPDIAFAVSVVSRFSANPTTEHWTAVMRIFRYLRGSLDLELAFTGGLSPLVGYSDADWAGDIETRRSTSGYVFSVGSAPISWSSKRQPTVSLSTCEAEYIGQTQATKEAVWLRKLLAELANMDHRDLSTTIIYGDNQGAIALARNPQFHGRSKHIDIQHHFVREKVEDGTVELVYVETSKQIADGLTKPLPKSPFVQFRKALGLQ